MKELSRETVQTPLTFNTVMATEKMTPPTTGVGIQNFRSTATCFLIRSPSSSTRTAMAIV